MIYFIHIVISTPQTLIVRDERISGTLPMGYPQALPQLQVLSLSGLQLTGTLPAAWADWRSLRQLALYSNNVRPFLLFSRCARHWIPRCNPLPCWGHEQCALSLSCCSCNAALRNKQALLFAYASVCARQTPC